MLRDRFNYTVPYLAFCLAVGLVLPLSVEAQQPSEQLKSVEQDLEAGRAKADALAREAEALSQDLLSVQRRTVEVAAEIMQRESEIQSLEDRLVALADRETRTAASLTARRAQYIRSVMAISRIARHPPEALLAQPLGPGDTVRSAILLRAAVPQVESIARELRADLDDLTAAKTEIVTRQAELNQLFIDLGMERETLKTLQAEKREARDQVRATASAEQRRIEKLAREAKSLRDLLAKIDAVRKKRAAEQQAQQRAQERNQAKAAKLAAVQPKAKPSVPDPQAAFARKPTAIKPGPQGLPVVGRVSQAFGKAETRGFRAKGISVITKPGAQVVAVQGGSVVFAGPFRGYGRLLIIDHGRDYHSLVAGLGRIDVELGHNVVSGEPVGVMAASQSGVPTLYFELRRRGQPINPLPWLASQSTGRRG